MALVYTIDNEYQLQREFIKFDRDYYTLDGYKALIDLFEETSCGENVEIEEIAECKDEDGEIDIEALMDALNYHTWAQLLDNGNIIYQTF